MLSIAGGGIDKDPIMMRINQLNLLEKITLHGRISAESLNDLLAKSYASILFSNYENLPCVIVEAFAAGVPFISTKVGGIEEIISKERGILIPPQNEKELVKAMNQVLIKRWDKKAIRDYAINSFSYPKIGQELNSIYEEIIDKK
jgi:glycosyltransferase involved in cell wall biosynthesis